jgi:hypothetical protein
MGGDALSEGSTPVLPQKRPADGHGAGATLLAVLAVSLIGLDGRPFGQLTTQLACPSRTPRLAHPHRTSKASGMGSCVNNICERSAAGRPGVLAEGRPPARSPAHKGRVPGGGGGLKTRSDVRLGPGKNPSSSSYAYDRK